jgi:putative hydrolase of the HAD superfamily
MNDETIDRAWNSLLLDFPDDRKHFLYELAKKYRLFLLSNTNEIHIRCFENILKRDHGKNFLPEVFEKTYYSSRLGMRKPDTEIFDFVLKDNGLDPHETIFIDDTERHVKGGQVAGISSYWLDVVNSDVIQLVKKIMG